MMSPQQEKLTAYGATTAHAHGNDDSEKEYDRLRDLARSEASKRSACFDKVRCRGPQPPTPTPPISD